MYEFLHKLMIIFLHDTKTTALPGGIIGEKTNSDRKI